jgi:hypothetical protein
MGQHGDCEQPRLVLQTGQRPAVENDWAGAAHEGLEQGELLGREGDLGLAAPDLARGGVEAQIAGLDDRVSLALPAADQGTQAGQELGEGKGLVR